VGYLAYGPLAFGLLTGAIKEDTTFHEQDWRSGTMGMGSYPRLFAPRKRRENLQKVERLRAIAQRLGTELAPLALRWVIQQQGVTAAIAGSRNPGHVRTNAAAGDLQLDADTLQEIWSFNLGTPITAPAMSYSVNGKQYIAIVAGGEANLRGAQLYQPGAMIAVFGL